MPTGACPNLIVGLTKSSASVHRELVTSRRRQKVADPLKHGIAPTRRKNKIGSNIPAVRALSRALCGDDLDLDLTAAERYLSSSKYLGWATLKSCSPCIRDGDRKGDGC